MVATVDALDPDPDLDRLVQYIHTLGVGCRSRRYYVATAKALRPWRLR
jgi:hypothetical protein